MAIKNPLNNFQWLIDLNGIPAERCQVVTAPKVEFAEHIQGSQGTETDTKTAGKKKVGDLVIEVVIPDTGDQGLWDLFEKAQTLQKDQYAGDGMLYEIGPNEQPSQSFIIEDAWIKSIESGNYETKQDNSDNQTRTITLSVKDYRRANA